ncbi:MAG: addiction module protein [Verrucomicrobiota bacterium]
MSDVAELLKKASKLDRVDREELISSLLEDLDQNPHHVSDEEALRRLEDLKSGKVKGLSEEEFWKACGRRS